MVSDSSFYFYFDEILISISGIVCCADIKNDVISIGKDSGFSAEKKEQLKFIFSKLQVEKPNDSIAEKVMHVQDRFNEIYGPKWRYFIIKGGEHSNGFFDFYNMQKMSAIHFNYDNYLIYLFQTKEC